MNAVVAKVREYIVENYLFGDDENLKDDSEFMEEGIIDSTGILELVTFLEDEFSITVEDDELIPENLNSLKNIGSYLANKM
jgi:acyl carrier protein